MITGEFLTADDLGPLGRLVSPGELLVLEPRDVALVREERAWVNERYLAADQRAEALRKRLLAARLGARGAAVRLGFEEWTIEAAKLGLCDRYLRAVVEKLDSRQQQAMDLPNNFAWQVMPAIVDVTRRVLEATDSEIATGIVFRAK